MMANYAGFSCPKCRKGRNKDLADWEVVALPEQESIRLDKRYGRVCNVCKMDRIKELGINPVVIELEQK
jgi:hypothetical protein